MDTKLLVIAILSGFTGIFLNNALIANGIVIAVAPLYATYALAIVTLGATLFYTVVLPEQKEATA